jgi:hypothetical protein
MSILPLTQLYEKERMNHVEKFNLYNNDFTTIIKIYFDESFFTSNRK